MNKDNKDKGRRSLGHSSNNNLNKLGDSSSSSSSSSNNIRVVCRFRPPKHGEVIANSDSCQVDLNK